MTTKAVTDASEVDAVVSAAMVERENEKEQNSEIEIANEAEKSRTKTLGVLNGVAYFSERERLALCCGVSTTEISSNESVCEEIVAREANVQRPLFLIAA